jgi:hypothetical protein
MIDGRCVLCPFVNPYLLNKLLLQAVLSDGLMIAATMSVPFRPHLFTKMEPVILNITETALLDDEIFLLLVFVYSEAKRQEQNVRPHNIRLRHAINKKAFTEQRCCCRRGRMIDDVHGLPPRDERIRDNDLDVIRMYDKFVHFGLAICFSMYNTRIVVS